MRTSCRGRLAVGLFAGLILSVGTGTTRADTPLRVVTWNIGVNGTGTDGRVDLNRVYSTLRAKAPDADLFICNECYSSTITDFTNRLTRDTGVTWVSTTRFDAGSHNHSGIISRYPFASSPVLFNYSQPATMSVGPKTAGEIDIHVNGKIVHVIVTRLCWPCGEAVRRVQGQELRAWAQTFGEPRIISGDFNDSVGSTNINAMGAGFYFDAYRQARTLGTATAYPDNPNGNTHGCGTLDYTWVSKGSSMTIVSANVPDIRIPPLMNPNPAVTDPVGCTDDYGVKPSDHNLLRVTIQVPTVSTASPCDVNEDGLQNISDVQLAVNQALQITACRSDLNADGRCNIVDIQRIVNAALGSVCLHS